MTNYKFTIQVLPLSNFLIGFSYRSGYKDDSCKDSIDEYAIGIGIISFILVKEEGAK